MPRAALLLGPLIVLLLAAGVAVVVTDGDLPDDAGIAEDTQSPDVADDAAGEEADPGEQGNAPRPSDDESGRDVTLGEPAPSPTVTAPGDVTAPDEEPATGESTAPDEEADSAPPHDRAEPIDTRGSMPDTPEATPDTPGAAADAALPQTGGTPAGMGTLLLAGAALARSARRRLVHPHTG